MVAPEQFLEQDEEGLIEGVPIFSEITDEIKVSVQAYFLGEQSDSDPHKYVWAYRVLIENEGDTAVQLVSRHWKITDSRGHTQEIVGKGVVGEQPTIQPDSSFTYTSGCPLSTPSGLMRGSYDVVCETGALLKVAIPAFSLDCPHDKQILN